MKKKKKMAIKRKAREAANSGSDYFILNRK